MMDEHFDRTYRDGRADLNTGLDRLFNRVSKTIAGTFSVGTRIQFDAPWSRRSSDAGCA